MENIVISAWSGDSAPHAASYLPELGRYFSQELCQRSCLILSHVINEMYQGIYFKMYGGVTSDGAGT